MVTVSGAHPSRALVVPRDGADGSRCRGGRDGRGGGAAALPAAGAPAGGVAEAAGLRVVGNQQLGHGAMMVGIQVGKARGPGSPPLAEVTRGAEFVGNSRGHPQRPRPQEDPMVVGARFGPGAPAERIAGTYRDNRNYDDGDMKVGYYFG